MGFGGPMQGGGTIQDMGNPGVSNPYGIDTSGNAGFLGGVINNQKTQMAQQLFAQQQESNRNDLAQQALTLKQNQANEAAYGQQERDVKGAAASDTLDLYKNGVMQAVHGSKLLSDLSASELEKITNHYKEQQQQLDTGRQQASLIDQSTGQVPFGIRDQIDKQRQQLNMKALPDDPNEAAAQLRSEEQQALHTGPRLDAAIAATNAAKLKQQEEAATSRDVATKVAGEANVATIGLGKMSTDQRNSNLEQKWQQGAANGPTHGLNPDEISALQNYKIVKDNNVFATFNEKMRQIMSSGDPAAKQVADTEQARKDLVPGYKELADAKVIAQKQEIATSKAKADAAKVAAIAPGTVPKAAPVGAGTASQEDAPQAGGWGSTSTTPTKPDPKARDAPTTPGAIRKWAQDPKTGLYGWGWDTPH